MIDHPVACVLSPDRLLFSLACCARAKSPATPNGGSAQGRALLVEIEA